MIWLFILILPIVISVFYKIYKVHRYWKDQNVLEVKPLPIIGNMLSFLTTKNYYEWLDEVYSTYNARCFGIYSYMQPILLLKDIDLIKKINIKDFDHFVDHANFFTESKEPVFRENIFVLKGEEWKKMRSILSPAFTGNKMRTMFILIRDCAQQFTNYCIENIKEDKNFVLCMKDFFSRFTTDVVATCAFGVECDSLKNRDNEFYARAKDVSNFGGSRAWKYLGFQIFPNVMNFFKIHLFSKSLIDFFYRLVLSTIELREKHNIYRPDMIHLLMEARKGKLKQEDNIVADDSFSASQDIKNPTKLTNYQLELTDEKLAGQALVFLIAGYETSSITLSFMAYELALHEDIQKKLQEEIDEAMQVCNGLVTYEYLMKMKYIDMVIHETLRLWSPVYCNVRICNKAYTIQPEHPEEKPIHLKVGDQVWFPTFSIQRDPKFYPNPLEFNPERFSDENKKNINPYSFMPFGIGPRNCMGYRFALLEMKTIMTYLLSKFSFVVVKETNIPVKIDRKQLILASEDGIYLGLKPRIPHS